MLESLWVDLYAADGEGFNSDSVDIAGYDREGKTLYIEFQSGATVYAYEGVEESTYNLLVTAPSVGRFYRNHIQGNYTSTKYPSGVIEQREDEDTPSETVSDKPTFKVGDRVLITFDARYDVSNVWDGPGTVTEVTNDCFIVKTDNDGRQQAGKTGGFYDRDLTLIENEGIVINGGNSTITIPVAATARYSVRWQTSDGKIGGHPEYTATNEYDALAQFNAAIEAVGFDEVKIVSVTRYFD